MQYFNLRNILALLLSIGLGTAVLGQSEDAMAEGYGDKSTEKKDDSSSTSQNKDDSSSTSPSADMSGSEQKAKDFKEWTDSEKPGDNVDSYASSGLTKLDDALGAVIQDVRSQPMGGGPSGDTKADKKEVKQEAKEMGAEALSGINTEQQKLSKVAGELSGDSASEQGSKQFHEAATATSQIFSSLQQARFPSLEKDVKKVQEHADKIDASKPLASQDKHVEKFFKESSKVLDKMSDDLKKDAIGGGPASDDETKSKGYESDDNAYDEVMPNMQ